MWNLLFLTKFLLCISQLCGRLLHPEDSHIGKIIIKQNAGKEQGMAALNSSLHFSWERTHEAGKFPWMASGCHSVTIQIQTHQSPGRRDQNHTPSIAGGEPWAGSCSFLISSWRAATLQKESSMELFFSKMTHSSYMTYYDLGLNLWGLKIRLPQQPGKEATL